MKKKVLCYEPYIFNPWWRVPTTCPSTESVGQQNSSVGAIDEGGVLEIGDDPTWKQPKRWNKKLAKEGYLGDILVGPACDWSDRDIPSATRERLWDIIGNTLYLDWWLLSKRTTNIVQSLPTGWRAGYEHVALGLIVESTEDFQEVENLKKIRTKSRFLEVSASLLAIEDLDLKGIHFVIIQAAKDRSAEHPNEKWIQRLKNHCVAQQAELKLVRV